MDQQHTAPHSAHLGLAKQHTHTHTAHTAHTAPQHTAPRRVAPPPLPPPILLPKHLGGVVECDEIYDTPRHHRADAQPPQRIFPELSPVPGSRDPVMCDLLDLDT
jgi:hypothetical protein